MRSSLRLAQLLLGMLLLLTLAPLDTLTRPASAAAFQISGVITGQGGAAVVGATVGALDTAGATAASTTTGADGSYALSVDAGTYDIQVTPPAGSSYQVSTIRDRVINADGVIDIALVSAGPVVVSGRLVNRTGNPVAGAQIQVGVAVDSTDADGRYALQTAPGQSSITIRCGSCASADLPDWFELGSATSLSFVQDTNLDLQLAPRRVEVRVQDAAGNPVADVTVRASQGSLRQISLGSILGNGSGGSSLRTTSEGLATFWLFASDTYFIATPAEGSSFVQTTQEATVNADGVVTITLLQPVTVSGRLVNRTGNPVAGAQIQVGVAVDSTDADGRYALQTTPGQSSITIRCGSCASADLPDWFELGSATSLSFVQDTNLDLQLAPRRVEVRVQDAAGNPVADVTMRASQGSLRQISLGSILGNGSGGSSLRTTSEGLATFWLFASDTYFIATPAEGSSFVQTTQEATVNADGVVTITLLQPVTVSGRLVNRTGNPVAGAQIQVGVAVDSTDADGRYALQTTPGQSSITIRCGSCASADLPDWFELGSATSLSFVQDTNLDLQLAPRRVEVRVQDAAGNPVADVTMRASQGSLRQISLGSILGNGSGGSSLRTTSEGLATFWLFASDTYFIATPSTNSPFVPVSIGGIAIASDQDLAFILQFVHAPPITTMITDLAQTSAGTYPGPVTVTLSATPASGETIAATYYTLDGGPPQIYAAPFAIAGDGDHTLRFWSIDGSGVYEGPITRTIRISTLRITTAPLLPGGLVGEPYSATLNATGGVPPYTWSLASGALPPGLALNAASGVISGTPTDAGDFQFAIAVSDSAGATAQGSFGLDSPPAPGTAGGDYSGSVGFTPTDSSDAVTTCASYALVSGALPEGLSLDPATGALSGTPIDGGDYAFTIACTTTGGQTAVKAFTITISNPAPVLTSISPSQATAGTGDLTITLRGSGFVRSATVRWGGNDRPTTYISPSELHAAIGAVDLAAAGVVDVTVFNPAPGGGASNALPFVVVTPNQPPALALPGAQVAQYSDQRSVAISATDPDNDGAELRFTASGLPAGLALLDNGDGTATISGAFEAPAGTYEAPISVRDPEGLTDVGVLTLVVAPEDAALSYTGDTGAHANAPLTLRAQVAEPGDGAPGDLRQATVIFELTTSAGASSSYGPVAATASGEVIYALPGGLTAGAYTVVARLDPAGGFYRAPASAPAALAIYTPPPPVPTCAGLPATIVGTARKDVIRGTAGDDVIVGLGGNDTIDGGSGNDVICGGDGNDTLKGDAGADRLFGEAGNDQLWGDAGDDQLDGGVGNDKLWGGAGADQLDGGHGNDHLDGGAGDYDHLAGGDGNDHLTDNDGVNNAHGGAGNDTITLTLRAGWRSTIGQTRFDGKLSGGHGDDTVTLTLKDKAAFFINITGDEQDSPPSPLEGTKDLLKLCGTPANAGSVIVKFERRYWLGED